MAITRKLKQISMRGLQHWKKESKSFKNSAINCLPVLFLIIPFRPYLNNKSEFWHYPCISSFHFIRKYGCSPMLPQMHFF